MPHRGSGQYPWRHCRVTVVVLGSVSRGMGWIAGPIEERAQLDISDSPRIRLDENSMLPRTNTPWSRQLLKAIYFAANRATANFIPNSAILRTLGESRAPPQAHLTEQPSNPPETVGVTASLIDAGQTYRTNPSINAYTELLAMAIRW